MLGGRLRDDADLPAAAPSGPAAVVVSIVLRLLGTKAWGCLSEMGPEPPVFVVASKGGLVGPLSWQGSSLSGRFRYRAGK